MAELYQYAVAVILYKPIIKRAVVDFAVGADWTPAAGDVKISKDGGAAANVTNLPTALAMGNTALWVFSLTATELTAKKIRVTVADAATKAVEDVAFEIDTYGNASAQHAMDLNDANATTAQVAAAVWDEAIAGHLTAGTTGAKLNTASAAGDPWSTALPGAYGAGTAGKILGDIPAKLPTALVGGRMDASVGAMAANVMTAAAAAADLTTELQTGLATAAALNVVDDFLDTEIAAIKAKTDQLVFTTANRVDAGVIDKTGFALSAAGLDAILDEVVEGTMTLRESTRLANAANAGTLSGAATTTVTVRDPANTKNRIVATVDANGNRTAVALDLS